jgi:hypothetical protein
LIDWLIGWLVKQRINQQYRVWLQCLGFIPPRIVYREALIITANAIKSTKMRVNRPWHIISRLGCAVVRVVGVRDACLLVWSIDNWYMTIAANPQHSDCQ